MHTSAYPPGEARFSGLPGGTVGGGGEGMAKLLAYHEPASGPV